MSEDYDPEALAAWERELLAAASTVRAGVLDDAKQAVCSDRNAEYGEPIDNLGRWAGACNALGYRAPGGADLKPHDMAVIMGLGKYARIVQSPAKQDHWVDAAGYPAIGYECVTLEGRQSADEALASLRAKLSGEG